MLLAGRRQLNGRRIMLEQIQHRWMIWVRSDHTLQCRMDLRRKR